MLLSLAKSAIFSIVLIFILNVVAVAAPAVVWQEDFQSYDVGTTSGSALDITGLPINWDTYTGACADWFEVRENPITGNKYMEARDLDGNGYWITDRIPIFGYTDVGISMEVAELGRQEWDDYMLMFYALSDTLDESRHWQMFDYRFDDFRYATAEISGLSGNYLSIGIVINNDSNRERHRFDNVMVTAGSVPVPASVLLLGSGLAGVFGFRRKFKKQ